MGRIIISDVKSVNNQGKSSGHYFSLAQDYIDLYSTECEVKVAGGPVYRTGFGKEQLFELPYDSVAGLPEWKQKWLTLKNCRYLFRHAKADDVIVLQHSAAATFMIGIALFAKRRNRIYVISYDTASIASPFKRFWYHWAKRYIKGFLCSNEHVAKAFGRPYCIIPDYIYSGDASRMQMMPYAEKKYDFAMLGTIWPDKGVLEAARRLAQTDYKVIIGGRACNEQLGHALQEACRGADNIELHLGFVSNEDYDRWIRESRYCLLNYQGTYSERSSGVVLDVLFRGVPVVGHRCFAMKFVEDEGCGYLYDDIERFDPHVVMDEKLHAHYLDGIRRYLGRQEEFRQKVVKFLRIK